MTMQSLNPEVFAAICLALWHHQGGSSPVGQPLRPMLGLGQHDHMTPDQIEAAKRLSQAMADASRKRPRFPVEAAKFKAWYDAWWLGDGFQAEVIPGYEEPDFPKYLNGYTLGFGAWMAAKHDSTWKPKK